MKESELTQEKLDLLVQDEITRRVMANITEQHEEKEREPRVRFYLAIPESMHKRYLALLDNGDLLPKEFNSRLVDAFNGRLCFFERLADTEEPALPSGQRVEPGEY